MKFFSTLVNKLSPKRDPAVLYEIIDELPNPRDWGTVDFIASNKLIFSEDIDLAAPNTDAIEALFSQYWQEIQSSGYQRIEYKKRVRLGAEKNRRKTGLGSALTQICLSASLS